MSQYEQIWKILSKYNFSIDDKDSEQFTCTFCHNIVNNAHSGPCDCIFCKECIGLYLLDGEKFCVGNTKKCQKKKLNIEKNIFRNDKVNKIISKIVVKCPSIMCDHECSLMKIYDHLIICERKLISCPFEEMGCNSQIERANMSDHLQTCIYDHHKLLIQWNISKEQKNKSEIKSEFKEINKNLEKSEVDFSKCINEAIQKQNISVDLILTDLNSVKIKNREYAILIKKMEETISYQNNKISELEQILYHNKFVRESKDINNSNFKHTYSVKSKSSTLGATPSKLQNTSEKDLQRSKTSIIRSTEINLGQRKSHKRFGEFINSFN